MNEFSARKLGEVLAFSRVGGETFKKGREAFEGVFGEAGVNELIEENKNFSEKILSIVESVWMVDIALNKAEATARKLRHMRDFYVGSEWHDPAEMLEWSGFFLGAAIVHWKLVLGVGEGLKNEELRVLAEHGVYFHEKMLGEVGEKIKEVGAKKAVS